MKRGRPRLDGLDDLLPGKEFVRDAIRGLAKAPERERALHTSVRPPIVGRTQRDTDFIARYLQGETLEQIGWVYMPKQNRKKPYMAKCGKTYLGYYATPEEAHAAYKTHCEKLNANRAAV